MIRKLFVLIVFLGACYPALAREKTDVIHMLNGDRITGEITKLEYGRLQIRTDSMGTLNIEWQDISTLISEHQFEFEMSNGERFYGTLEEGAAPTVLILLIKANPNELAFKEVVRITPIEDTFVDRLTGSLSVGYNYTKASDVAQFSFISSTTYRTRERAVTLNLNAVVTSDQVDDVTERYDTNVTTTRFRADRWYNSWIAGFEHNDELGLDLRTSFGGGIGRHFFQNDISDLTWLVGGLVTHETLVGDAETENNIEGLLRLSYARYIFNDPNVDLSTQLTVFPSLTSGGRYRAQFDARARYELVQDLFLDFTLYGSFDNEPPSGVGATSDYGVITSFGFTF